MKLRQCVFVCKDLESSRRGAVRHLGIEVAYRDPGVAKWGLANVVCPTGHDFLEIVSPDQPGTSAGRYIERRKGDGGYMVIIQVPDAGGGARADHRRSACAPSRRRTWPNTSTRHFHPADTAGVLLSLDRRSRRRASIRRCGGRRPRRTGCRMRARTSPRARRRRDPGRRSGRGGRELVEDPQPAGRRTTSSASTMTARSASCRSPTGAGPGVSAYRRQGGRSRARAGGRQEARQASRGPAQVEVCGCRINLV